MATGARWAELLTCPNCRKSGLVQLSQPGGSTYEYRAESVPDGFKIACTEYGELYWCRGCRREAIHSDPGRLHATSKPVVASTPLLNSPFPILRTKPLDRDHNT